MDEFRTLVKVFEMLDNEAKFQQSRNAFVKLSAMQSMDPDLHRKLREFVHDHLIPAKTGNIGTLLGTRQDYLRQSLEHVLWRLDPYANSFAVPPRQWGGWHQPALVGHVPAPAPAAAGVPTMAPGVGGGNNIFHTLRAGAGVLAQSRMTTETAGQGSSQLEQVHAWGGDAAVRGMLGLDDLNHASAGKARTVQEQQGDAACRDASERYGGVWSAPSWGGKGAPERKYAES